MLELPEVETIRQSLEPLLLQAQLRAIVAWTPGIFINWAGQSAEALDASVTAIRRRGKYLCFELDSGLMLVVHLRMTGQLLYREEEPQPLRHDHVLLKLRKQGGGPAFLVYRDMRRFGRLWLLSAAQMSAIPGLAALGPEPLDPTLTGESLNRRLARRAKSSLKAAVLAQTVIAGLGNIYADESLFCAGIHPARPAGSLSPEEADHLLSCIRSVLTTAIRARGTSIRDYVDAWNVRGTFQNQLQVYGRSGQPCTRCGQSLQKIRLSGRTTVFCPSCQSFQTPIARTGQ
jgi:formamidopyrimidine-DNA glycosylase